MEFVIKIALLFNTVRRLGFANVITVALYRLALRSGLIERTLPIGKSWCQPLFRAAPHHPMANIDNINCSLIITHADRLLEGQLDYFSNKFKLVGSPPNWFLNPFNGQYLKASQRHWSRINDFDTGVGDIKVIWEASRFTWTLILARAFRLTGDQSYLETLNAWIGDWTAKNPVNAGPNWKCGQETAIRMLQVLLAAYILEQAWDPETSLIRFVTEHCCRIEPTIYYAIAQDNNHGVSEAAGLFIAGAWLLRIAPDNRSLQSQAKRWYKKGRYWLENRVNKLVEKDGSFSQYSLNYHRVLLDTLNLVELWRRELQLTPFSRTFYNRAQAATEWLFQMIEPESGDGPNLGANDGAKLFSLCSLGYRDFRPSVQLGTILFCGGRAYPTGPWDETFSWLNLSIQPKMESGLSRSSQVFRDGGFVTMHSDHDDGTSAWGMIRFPNFHFRPGPNALHFDLWFQGCNLLRDSGTYSYNANEPWQNYFGSTESHNTIQFDGRDQMPKLSRFLYGAWLNADSVGELVEINGGLFWEGGYTDFKGCHHKRSVFFKGAMWYVQDEVEGFEDRAVLRWRLAPDNWELQNNKCKGDLGDLTISTDKSVKRLELVQGWESRFYYEKTPLSVLEVEVGPGKAIILTSIRLKGGRA